MRAAEDRQGRAAHKAAPLRVRPRDVADESAVRSGVSVEQVHQMQTIFQAIAEKELREQDADLGVDASARLKTLKVVEPAARKAGGRVNDVAALIDKLKNEAKVI